MAVAHIWPGAAIARNPDRARSVFPVHVEHADTAELAAWTGLSRVLINSDEFISRN